MTHLQKNATHGKSNTAIYRAWNNIKKRCFKKNIQGYENYGGRGIVMCPEWLNDFMTFYNWSIANGYKDGLSIDRKENDGNYEPNNCRWINKNVQQRNTRKLRKNNTSGYRGVSWSKNDKNWQARIRINNKLHYLGSFDDKEKAARAYDNYVTLNDFEHTKNFS